MKHHPDSEIIRRMLCGPIVSGTRHELPCSAHHQSGDITKVTRVVRTRLKTGPHTGTTAPAAAEPSPLPAAVGAFIVPSFAHATDVTSQEQQKS